MNKTTTFSGIISAAGAYILWGILPIYWKIVSFVAASEILAHRIIWSFVFMVLVILVLKQKEHFLAEVSEVLASRKKLAGILAATCLISANWFIFIWAVNASRIVETSLGYYINPLITVLLGIIVLKEKLSFWQMVSVLLAGMGVLYMAVHFGSIPWVSLSLALTFGLYGLCKKQINISAMTSVTLETLLAMPMAALYVIYLGQAGMSAFSFSFDSTTCFLMGAGAVTAIPLLLFARGASRLSLTVLGFVQYFSPTITLLLGIFLYHENFTQVHVVAFSFIWLALVVFSLAKMPLLVKIEEGLRKRLLCEKVSS
ncbi:MAG: EamA family transporter RarD [Pelosinus sp.]|nr:EamA family transporter RarD [Pelosinus sp.]